MTRKKVSGKLTFWSGKRDPHPRLRRGYAHFHILPGPPTEGDPGPRVQGTARKVWAERGLSR